MRDTKPFCTLAIPLAAIGVMTFAANAQAQTTLSFDTLPSAQAWAYVDTDPPSDLEEAVFSVDGVALHQNSMGLGGVPSYYFLQGVVNPALPFTLSITAKVLEEEMFIPNLPCGFAFEVGTGSEMYSVCVGTDSFRIGLYWFDTQIDNTVFHEYRLEATPPDYRFFVDGILVDSGAGLAYPRNGLLLGDITGAANAQAEIIDYAFDQTGSAVTKLVQDVLALNLQTGISNSLDAKLDRALSALDDVNEHNDVAAVNSLQAFVNAVEAQRGNKIPETDADAVIAAAQAVIGELLQ